MSAFILGLGVIIIIFLYRIHTTLRDAYEVLASLCVHENMDGEHAAREDKMRAALEVIEGKSIIYRRLFPASDELRDYRASVEDQFKKIEAKIAARSPVTSRRTPVILSLSMDPARD